MDESKRDQSSTSPEAIVIPLKAFHNSKTRLRDELGIFGAGALAEKLASHVLEASKPRARIVVSDNNEILDFAATAGAIAFRTAFLSLNGAISDVYGQLGGSYKTLIIVHGDLARPEGLGVARFSENISIYTDYTGTGTNVMVLPTGLDFRFAYGPFSAQAHEKEALRLGVKCEVFRDSAWQFDVDEPGDTRYLAGQ
jgi:2-phospho-L-lactate guanylyltransferase (CobY/MobA/RfbA family)